MVAETLPIKIERGANFDEQWTWADDSQVPIDLTGYSGSMIVHVIGSPGDVVLEATTANAKLALGGALGTIDIDFTAAETAAVSDGNYFYVLELTSGGGIVYRVAEGIAKVVER